MPSPSQRASLFWLSSALCGLCGSWRPLFASDALTLLHEVTAGQLRDIDRLATNALRTASRSKLKHVDRELLQDIIDADTLPD